MPYPTSPVRSPEWYDNCFGIGKTDVPADLRRLSEAVCNRFDISGICDPMYIANVAAFELGRGDGRGVFHDADSTAKEAFDARLAQVANRLLFAYSSCIPVSEAECLALLQSAMTPPSPATLAA